MTAHGQRKERRPRAALLGAACLLAGVLGFGAAVAVGLQGEPQRRLVIRPAAAPAITLADDDAPVGARPLRRQGHREPRRPARPVAIVAPAIALRARVTPVGLAPDRTLRVPRDPARAGWWKRGARPGAPGPAVIVGHVDSTAGPAVFYRVGLLRRGDAIRVIGADGRVARFRVRRVAHYPKRRFPTAQVYGPTRGPTLRLVTCSGAFDTATGHYLDNTIVFATAAAPASASASAPG